MNKIKNWMKREVRSSLDSYLDNANCFNATLLAEIAINELDNMDEDEDVFFDAAVDVADWATHLFKLNI